MVLGSFVVTIYRPFAPKWDCNSQPARGESAGELSRASGLVGRLLAALGNSYLRSDLGAASFSDGRNDLPTAIRGPPPPRVAHSTPLGLLYLGTHGFLRRAAGSVVAPGFVVLPRPSGASAKGVCTRLGGFPAPDRKAYWWVPPPSGLKKYPGSRKCSSFSSRWQSA